MNTKKILKELGIVPNKEDIAFLKKEAHFIVSELKEEISNNRIIAEVFIGGSFAKKTIVKKKGYDIDIFVRLDQRHTEPTQELERVIKNVSKKIDVKIEKVHGSRDYFRINKEHILFEIIPVIKINKPKEAKNVTDLSYFHVNYVKRKINENMAHEIILAKTFFDACGVYGAESYIHGFSGYALECLLIHYGSFERMIKSLVKVNEKLFIDDEKQYKNKNEILISLNESKLQSPIVLVDPTWKERNVLAALSDETFKKLQQTAITYLKRPSIKFFIKKEINEIELKKSAKEKKAELIHIRLRTNKQNGDIAGTKMKKFSRFLANELSNYFESLREEFLYYDRQEADFYLILKAKKEFIKIGPPLRMENACRAFKKVNKISFEKNGVLVSRIKINYSARRFIERWIEKYQKKIKEMDITEIEIK